MLRPHSVAVGASALLLSVAFAARSEPPRAQDEDLESRLARRVESFVSEHGPSALAVVVEVGGEPLLARGWGERGRRPVDAHTGFPAGPMTEVCVAAGVMQCVARGDLDLDARLGSVLEEFAEDARPLSVGQLLGHASPLFWLPSSQPSCPAHTKPSPQPAALQSSRQPSVWSWF